MIIQNILEERQKTHGPFEDVARTAQQIKWVLTVHPNVVGMSDVKKEALAMIATKIARIVNGDSDNKDHWRDIAGYAQLVVQSIEEK